MDYDFREQTPLYQTGYKISGLSRDRRSSILADKAVPMLGLFEVAETIANNRRLRKLQYDGEVKYAHTIGEWEHDLARLRRVFHDGSFTWPSTDVEDY